MTPADPAKLARARRVTIRHDLERADKWLAKAEESAVRERVLDVAREAGLARFRLRRALGLSLRRDPPLEPKN